MPCTASRTATRRHEFTSWRFFAGREFLRTRVSPTRELASRVFDDSGCDAKVEGREPLIAAIVEERTERSNVQRFVRKWKSLPPWRLPPFSQKTSLSGGYFPILELKVSLALEKFERGYDHRKRTFRVSLARVTRSVRAHWRTLGSAAH